MLSPGVDRGGERHTRARERDDCDRTCPKRVPRAPVVATAVVILINVTCRMFRLILSITQSNFIDISIRCFAHLFIAYPYETNPYVQTGHTPKPLI